ncbi:HAD family hydrolase [Actinoallomurus sp. CA-150999]|uniref:HAD family hydrolase n=1 Tax=Actinoallomurus sp. CA-150999 TaxID=3239887 RepID=UPI003D8B2383
MALINALEAEDAETVTAIPGAVELLASLPRDRWATVTSRRRDLAVARLTAAGLPVPDVLVTAEVVTEGKPHPEGYLAAARRWRSQATRRQKGCPAGLA